MQQDGDNTYSKRKNKKRNSGTTSEIKGEKNKTWQEKNENRNKSNDLGKNKKNRTKIILTMKTERET